ncbi:MAG: Asp-tRNA(Asn)/Glu-tRNA(Gln) amidotransferase subunit GatA [Gammaproteobacteria bacterium]
MHRYTIKQLLTGLNKKDFSAVELTQHFNHRIQTYDQQLNSFITHCADTALEEAAAADAQRAKGGDLPPLLGIPLAQKDIFCTKGVKTSCGSKMLDNFIAPYDATVIERFRAAGATLLGKTNMDEFAMGSSNESSYYGPCRNPWQIETVPGGSSGGSAAAVAARLAPGATGTDTGGSIRQPAALCGLTGIKPTYGRVSRFGMVAFASSLDQGGPMAATAEDCALMLNAMAGFDPKDSTSLEKPVPDYTATLDDSLAGLNIGIPKEYFAEGLDPQISKLVVDAIAYYEKNGAILHEITLPHTELGISAYYVVAPAECSANLARFDGVRYGYRCDNPQNITDLYSRSRAEGFGEEVKHRILTGTYVLSSGYYDAYYLKAQKIRRLISEDFKKAFEQVDVIMGPTSPSLAFPLGARQDDPISMYLSDVYTVCTNLAGLPGISIPVGFANGLPVGLQIIGNYFEEGRLLNVAHRYQQDTQWHSEIPKGFEE